MKIPICLLIASLLLSCAKDEVRIIQEENLIAEDESAVIEEEIINDTIPDTNNIYNYLFTDQAKNTLKARFENGYVTGAGFEDEISKTINDAAIFAADPSRYRPVLGATRSVHEGGQALHTTALYAYAIDDVALANVAAAELLAIVNTNDLYTAYWNDSGNYRWDADDVLWIQSAKVKKMSDSYYFIEQLQTVLSDADRSAIEAWFGRYADLAYAALRPRLEAYFGVDWDVSGMTSFYPEGLYPGGIENPVQDASGNDMAPFTMSWAQDIFNNRQWDAIGYIHSWAIKNDDREKENWAREFFKSFIKYGVFPDGTMAEMWRNVDDDVTKGVFYGWISTGGAVQMAHYDAIANHYPADRLYDFKTTEGIVQGSTDLTPSGYAGGSTTDGATQKSLLTLLKGQSNYLRSTADGGWNDVRFFRKSDNSVEPLTTVGVRQPSTHAAIANLYYKSQELKDFYLYNTAVGYPVKVTRYEGYMASVQGNEDMGPWGNMILGAAWLEQENNFFD